MSWIPFFVAFAALLWVFLKRTRDRAGVKVFSTADIPFKARLRWVGIGVLALLAFTAFNILICYLHHVPIAAVFWVFLLVFSVAAAMIFRVLMRQSASVG
jgi:hypothetical protein